MDTVGEDIPCKIMPNVITISLPEEHDTYALGQRLSSISRIGDVIGLSGKLGAGKTVLARGIIQAWTDRNEEVPSPTYALVQIYEHNKGIVSHFDLYRLAALEDALELGIDEAISTGLTLIEWPERLGDHMPRHSLNIHLSISDNNSYRIAELRYYETWDTRLSNFR